MRIGAPVFVGFVLLSCGRGPQVRAPDLASWRGIPLIELETHPDFSSMPLERRSLSDGSELRTYSACGTYVTDSRCTAVGYANWATVNCRNGQKVTRCCDNQFLVRSNVVEWYRTVGPCMTACWVRPISRPCSDAEAASDS